MPERQAQAVTHYMAIFSINQGGHVALGLLTLNNRALIRRHRGSKNKQVMAFSP